VRGAKLGLGIAIGVAIGAAIGSATQHLAVWTGLGAPLGVAIGTLMARRPSGDVPSGVRAIPPENMLL